MFLTTVTVSKIHTHVCVAPAAECARDARLSLLASWGQSQRRHPLIEHQRLLGMSAQSSHAQVTTHLELEQADVIDLGVALKLGVADDPLQVPGLLLVLPVDELDAPGHDVQGGGDHVDAAAGGRHHPVLVNHRAATEVGDAETPET